MLRVRDRLKRPVLRALMRFGRQLGARGNRPVRLPASPRVLIIQLGGFGDVLRVFPLIETLHTELPDAKISLLTNHCGPLLDLYSGPVRPRCIHFDPRWGYRRKLQELSRLRRDGFDVVFSPTRGDGILECAVMAWLTGAPNRVGFESDGAGFPLTWKQTFQDDESILVQNQQLLEALGMEPGPAQIRVRIPESARTFARDWYTRRVPAHSLRVMVHPWASSHAEFRAWPFQNYVQLIMLLLEERDAVVGVLGGAAEAAANRSLLVEPPSDRIYDLTGVTDLAQAAALIAGCDLFIGNDSGLLHFAAAAGVPTVAIFGATPADQVLPPAHGVSVVSAGVPCQPCYRHQPLFDYRCGYGFRCLAQLPVQAVLSEVLRVSRKSPNGAAGRRSAET